MAKRSRTSAGILLYRRSNGRPEVLLAHPGGPFFARKDAGHWTIPKGEVDPGEEPLDVARREFEEETGHAVPAGALVDLGSIVQKGGKLVHAWAAEGDLDPAAAVSEATARRRSSFVRAYGFARRRKRLSAARCIDLEQLDRLWKATEAPRAEWRDGDAIGVSVAKSRVDGRGHQDLAAVSGEADSSRGVHGEADVAGVRQRRTAAVEADPQPDVGSLTGPSSLPHRALDRERRLKGCGAFSEDGKRLVPTRVDLVTPRLPHRDPDEAADLRQQRCVGLS